MGTRASRQLTALVTGASSGLGEALARELSARGLRLVLASENAPELERVRGELAARGEVRALVEDLTLPDAPERLHARCRELGWPVDVLVNCAGMLLTVERELAEPGSVPAPAGLARAGAHAPVPAVRARRCWSGAGAGS